jgi:hypothetical protein|uniref:Uncharacterized protein n=1 Tax=Zea mays TaxID=4577 RepID=A0A804UG29_MAIZE
MRRGIKQMVVVVVVLLTAEPCLPPWLLGLLGLLLPLGRRQVRRRLPPAAAADVLVVVHPDLEDLPPDADLVAEVLHQRVVLLLHPPAEAFRERQHLLLLLRRELGPDPLPPDVALRVRVRRGGEPGRRATLLAGRLGRGAAGRAVVREQRRRRVVGVGSAGRVGVGRRQEQRDARDRRGGRRQQELVAAPRVALAVEAAVAAAGCALEPVGVLGHELAAAIDDVSAQRRRVVAQTLVVRRLGGVVLVPRAAAGAEAGRRRGARAHLLRDGLLPLLGREFHQRMPACPSALPRRRGRPAAAAPSGAAGAVACKTAGGRVGWLVCSCGRRFLGVVGVVRCGLAFVLLFARGAWEEDWRKRRLCEQAGSGGMRH